MFNDEDIFKATEIGYARGMLMTLAVLNTVPPDKVQAVKEVLARFCHKTLSEYGIPAEADDKSVNTLDKFFKDGPVDSASLFYKADEKKREQE